MSPALPAGLPRNTRLLCWAPLRAGSDAGPALPTLLGGSTRFLDHSGSGSATPEGASQWELLTGSRTRGPAPGRSPPCFCLDLTLRVRTPPHAEREAYHRQSAAPSRLGRGGSPGRR